MLPSVAGNKQTDRLAERAQQSVYGSSQVLGGMGKILCKTSPSQQGLKQTREKRGSGRHGHPVTCQHNQIVLGGNFETIGGGRFGTKHIRIFLSATMLC